jgi:UDPglucose 6-dehydrogenase
MKIGIIGVGYVGLVTAACFAESGNDVCCMDINENLIKKLKDGICPIYEPQLEDLLQKNNKENRLSFTTDLKTLVNESKVIFFCLPTPPNEDGSADLSRVLEVSKSVAGLIEESKIIVLKSTVPVGTHKRVKDVFKSISKHKIHYVSNPEFLKEGAAVQDFMSPDRVVIGSSSDSAIDALKELYSAFMRTSDRIIVMDEKSAEITKYASNSMLATRISFMNDIAKLCEEVGANIDSIRIGMGTDYRIGDKFLFAGIGYGGSCFPKDVKALIKTGEENGIDFKILKAVEDINEYQKTLLYHKIKRHFGENLHNKKFAVWGLAFKPKTDDIRFSPALKLIQMLCEEGAKIYATDPAAIENAKNSIAKKSYKIKFYENNYDTLRDVDALILATEWSEYRRPDFDRMKQLMRHPVIFDGRNIYNSHILKQKKFVYYGIGKI